MRLSALSLKLIAIAAMVVDHVAFPFVPYGTPLWTVMDAAGKLTGPSSWDGYVACVAGDALNASRGTSQFMKVETMEKPEMYK